MNNLANIRAQALLRCAVRNGHDLSVYDNRIGQYVILYSKGNPTVHIFCRNADKSYEVREAKDGRYISLLRTNIEEAALAMLPVRPVSSDPQYTGLRGQLEDELRARGTPMDVITITEHTPNAASYRNDQDEFRGCYVGLTVDYTGFTLLRCAVGIDGEDDGETQVACKTKSAHTAARWLATGEWA